jgi:hypothetical protein
MSTSKLEPSVENRPKSSIENRFSRFFNLAVAFEMNPSLRDLSDEELSDALASQTLTNDLSHQRQTKP